MSHTNQMPWPYKDQPENWLPEEAHDAHASSGAAHAAHAHPQGHHHAHPSPYQRLRDLLSVDKSDLYALLAYTLLSSMLSLAIPLAAQALVNTIAQGIFLLPLVVLALLTLTFMLIVGCLKLIQLSLVETLQQRVFARVAIRVSHTLIRIQNQAFSSVYVPEMVNRFFDVLTIQKALSKLLVDGLTVVISALGGLMLMAFYSWHLLAFDLAVIAFILFILFVLGHGGLQTSIRESLMKYRVAEWLEEIARCHISLKLNGTQEFMVRRSDELVVDYLRARKAHFRILFRQAMGNHLFQAMAFSGVLAIGGWLVISKQLTLGQLVAAELVIVSMLANIDKLIAQCEHVYDLLTGLDKVGHVTDLPTERVGGLKVPNHEMGATIQVRNLDFSYGAGKPALYDINIELSPGDRVGLIGVSGAGKSTLASLVCGLEEPIRGSILVNGIDVRDADLASLRKVVAIVDDNEDLFAGSIEDNILCGRPGITREQVRRSLQLSQLEEEVARLSKGLQTQLISGGKNMSRGQRQRILIARAVLDNPQLLILDEAFTGIEEKTRQRILDGLYDSRNGWSILAITHLDEVVVRNRRVYVLADGRIAEFGDTLELANRKGSEFARLFPFLCDQQAIKRSPNSNDMSSGGSEA